MDSPVVLVGTLVAAAADTPGMGPLSAFQHMQQEVGAPLVSNLLHQERALQDVPTPTFVGVPQFGQKRMLSGTCVPQFEQELLEFCVMVFFPFDNGNKRV